MSIIALLTPCICANDRDEVLIKNLIPNIFINTYFRLLKNLFVNICKIIGISRLIRLDYFIIDDACQSVELSCLIPFVYNPRHAILIGDPTSSSQQFLEITITLPEDIIDLYMKDLKLSSTL
ncbi:unnamed protein product [Blepharisma stoltei]|uniref:DNA2/NAM7 helicase helicase domain-containing protein n=1 Tax=Blepharisma stoltei TaxID=1481888 RepID=A0AAU9J2H7_9CILI|nr:unnamed protein product [Blepharisma stoltei]